MRSFHDKQSGVCADGDKVKTDALVFTKFKAVIKNLVFGLRQS